MAITDLAKELRGKDVIEGLADRSPCSNDNGNKVEHLPFKSIPPSDPEALTQDFGECLVEELVRGSRALLVDRSCLVEGAPKGL